MERKELEKRLSNHPFGSQEDLEDDAEVIATFFNPVGKGVWLITEAEKQPDGDWLMFGYCKITDWEWGDVSLRELQNIRLPFGMTIELNKNAKGTVKELSKVV